MGFKSDGFFIVEFRRFILICAIFSFQKCLKVKCAIVDNNELNIISNWKQDGRKYYAAKNLENDTHDDGCCCCCDTAAYVTVGGFD